MSKQPCRLCGCTQARACVEDDGPCWWVQHEAPDGLELDSVLDFLYHDATKVAAQ